MAVMTQSQTIMGVFANMIVLFVGLLLPTTMLYITYNAQKRALSAPIPVCWWLPTSLLTIGGGTE